MKIGIISKKSHAKSHAEMLEELGHSVVLLGGSPTSVPASIEVTVCRVVSCSHAASALAAKMRRNGRKVIFEDSVTRLKQAVERLEKAESSEGKEADTTPVKGVLYRAYRDNRGGHWYVKTGRRWRKHVACVKTRERAEAIIAELDHEAMSKAHGEGSDIAEAKPEVQEHKAKDKTQDELVQDLRELMSMLEETMTSLGWERYQHGDGVEVKLLKRHLFTPGGPACGSTGGKQVKELGHVTCKACCNTKVFSQAQWMVEHLRE